MLRSLLALVFLLSCTEAFCQDSRRPLALHKHAASYKVAPIHTTGIIASTTALQEATIAPPLDESDDVNVIEKIREGPAVLRDGAAEGGSFLERHPFASAALITTFNAFFADFITQVVFGAGSWNRRRSALFAVFGFLYQGCVQYAIVNWGWERLFPGTKPRNVVAKIFAMNLLSDPLLFMPAFYIFRGFLVQGTLNWAIVKAALLGYKANALVDWRNSWMIWFPGHAVTYGVMPEHKRIPWIAFLSFFYMCILSLTRGG